jgi:hypothetical protein
VIALIAGRHQAASVGIKRFEIDMQPKAPAMAPLVFGPGVFAATARRVLASLRIFPMKVEYASTSFYS